MNRASLLLLVTLVQSQSDGVLLPNADHASENFDDGYRDSQLEGWDEGGSLFPVDLIADYGQVSEPFKKRSTGDAFTRRSALDKNFMRFGRTPRLVRQLCTRAHAGSSDGKPSFFRFGRGSKDNFIRFGRGAKDSFIRFGRSRPEDFFRAVKSMRDNFIRFGKADQNFMRFGRNGPEEEDALHLPPEYPDSGLESPGESPKVPEELQRSAKDGGQKERRNGTNFLRFGKKEATETEAEEAGQEDGPGKRRRRAADDNQSERAKFLKRSTGFFDHLPENLPRRLSPLFVGNSWQSLENLRNSRLIPFFPFASQLSKISIFPAVESGPGAKRNQGGGSNFIRFG